MTHKEHASPLVFLKVMSGALPFSVGSALELLRQGAISNWWGLACPSQCGPPSVTSLFAVFVAGLGIGFSLGILLLITFGLRLGFLIPPPFISQSNRGRPSFSADSRLAAYVHE